jgi:hypothetical protein
MLTGIHFLLTYVCTYECDHCFVYSGPHATGTFTIDQIQNVLDESKKLGTVKSIYFEGGEPFLFYPLMIEGARRAREIGFDIGVVTNSYWATSPKDAELWLKPFAKMGIKDLSISDDLFHFGIEQENYAKNALKAAENLGLPTGSICIKEPVVESSQGEHGEKGKPVIGGNVLFKGRAVEKLSDGLPIQNPANFKECPHEELVTPGRVHVDAFGHMHICQGLSMGNMWKTPLSEIAKNYNPNSHPICGPLIKGGPAELARKYNLKLAEGYIDACHMCFLMRKALIDRFPEFLCPGQIYGLE